MTFLGPIERLHFWQQMHPGSYTKGIVLRRETDGADDNDRPAAIEARYSFYSFKGGEVME
jgi:hypothetical protein